jgi:hypothetical protein
LNVFLAGPEDPIEKTSKFGLRESKAQNENNITSKHINISLCLNYRFLSRPANAFVTIPYVAKKRPGYILSRKGDSS